MAVNYNINPLGGFDLGGALQGLGQQFGKQREQAELKQSRESLQNDIRLASSGDPDAMDSLMGKNPKIAMIIQDRNRENSDRLGAEQALVVKDSTTDAAMRYINATPEQRPALIKEFEADQNIDFDSEDAQQPGDFPFRAVLYENKGKDFYKTFLGGGAAVEKPAGQLEFEALIADMTPEQQNTAKLVKAGLKGRAMSNAELSAIESGDIKSYSDWKAQMKQAQKFAEMTGSSRAKAIDRGFNSIVKIDTGIRNIDRAVEAVKSGAGVGAVEKLWPSIKSSSVELDNIRGQMALDVVGATTFGALSKGELDLAKDIALPTGLDSDELVDYLTRKKAAQEKLRAYYNEQIQFLDQGGTIAGFLRMKERGQGGQDQQINQAQEQSSQTDQPQVVNWSDL